MKKLASDRASADTKKAVGGAEFSFEHVESKTSVSHLTRCGKDGTYESGVRKMGESTKLEFGHI